MPKLSVSDFLAKYSAKHTQHAYFTSLMEYFETIYPNITELGDRSKIRSELDRLSILYLSEQRDIRSDLLRFRDSIKGNARISEDLPLFSLLHKK